MTSCSTWRHSRRSTTCLPRPGRKSRRDRSTSPWPQPPAPRLRGAVGSCPPGKAAARGASDLWETEVPETVFPGAAGVRWGSSVRVDLEQVQVRTEPPLFGSFLCGHMLQGLQPGGWRSWRDGPGLQSWLPLPTMIVH